MGVCRVKQELRVFSGRMIIRIVMTVIIRDFAF